MRAPSHQIAVAKTLAEVDALREEWDALARRAPEATGFQSHAWCRAWLATAIPVRRGRLAPRVVVVRENGRLVMLWPLQMERHFGLRIVRWIGEPMTQYGDALAEQGAEREAWRDLALRAMRRWRDADLVLLPRIRADGVLAVAGGAVPEDAPQEILAEEILAPFVDLTGRAPLAIARDKSLARRERKLCAGGPVSLDVVDTPDARALFAHAALRMKQAWLRKRRLYSRGLSDPAATRFIEAAAREGSLRVSVLWVGAKPAAIDLGLADAGGYRSFLAAFDEAFAHGSPGNVLTARLAQRCRDEGLPRFDLLAPADAYKMKWADGTVALCTRTLPLTWRGAAAGFALTRLRPLAKRLVQALGRWRRRHTPPPGEAAPGKTAPARAPAPRRPFVLGAAMSRVAALASFKMFL